MMVPVWRVKAGLCYGGVEVEIPTTRDKVNLRYTSQSLREDREDKRDANQQADLVRGEPTPCSHVAVAGDSQSDGSPRNREEPRQCPENGKACLDP